MRKLDARDSSDTAQILRLLAESLRGQGKLEEAETTYREALKVMRELPGFKRMDLSGVLNNFGLLLKLKGNLAEAEALFREAFEISHKEQKDHPFVLIQAKNLAGVL